MKRVSSEITKYLELIGYPLSYSNVGCEDDQIKTNCSESLIPENPTYIEVWLWLWREKKIELSFDYGARYNDIDEILYCNPLTYHTKSHPLMNYIIDDIHYHSTECCSCGHTYNHKHADPEEAIANTIDYLIGNKLLS